MQALKNLRTLHTRLRHTLSTFEAAAIISHALANQATTKDAKRFTGNVPIEMASINVEGWLEMQLPPGCNRDHNPLLFKKISTGKSHHIPVRIEWAYILHPRTGRFGNDTQPTLVHFTIDNNGYTQGMANLAGHDTGRKLNPSWWFHDSLKDIMRYFDQVTETAELYNIVGFIDHRRALGSMAARLDVCRRAGRSPCSSPPRRRLVWQMAWQGRPLSLDSCRGDVQVELPFTCGLA